MALWNGIASGQKNLAVVDTTVCPYKRAYRKMLRASLSGQHKLAAELALDISGAIRSGARPNQWQLFLKQSESCIKKAVRSA